MRWLNVETLMQKNRKELIFVSYLMGVWFWDFVSYSKAVSVDRSFWKISHHSKLIWLEFAASLDNVDNFHFLFLSRKFPQRQCAYNKVLFLPLLSGLPLRNSRGAIANKETHCFLSLLLAMGTFSENYPSWGKIRTKTNSRTRISLYSWTVHRWYTQSWSWKCRFLKIRFYG